MKQLLSKKIFLLLTIFATGTFAFSNIVPLSQAEHQEQIEKTEQFPQEENTSYYKPTALNHILGFTEPFLANLTIWSYDKFILDAPFVQISPETVKRNFTTPWVWDQDEFYVNHFCHPYIGSIYYTSARSNNLPVWESFLAALSGSLTWELFAENELPSYNDLIITTIGGFSFGEILHRLYYVVADKSRFAATLINPMASLNNLIFRNRTNNPNGEITTLETKLFTGLVNKKIYFKETNSENNILPMFFYGGAELNLIYGDPYGHKTTTPYTTFDMNIKVSGTKNYYNMSLFTDGIILSFAPNQSDTFHTTLGLSLHYDFLLSNITHYSKNALSLTAKQQIELPNNWDIKWALHLNYIFLGGNDFYYLFSKSNNPFELDIPNRLYDLTWGGGVKSSFSISNPYAGTLKLYGNFDISKTINNSLPEGGSYGFFLIGIASASYEHKIFKSFSMGLEYDFYMKNANYKTAEDLFEIKQIANIYFKNKFN